ncbi:MAG: transketolase-like TK C-terminal-containing protein, partial [Gammaproteobacteria bacterium]
PHMPELIGGSADLKESNLVFWSGSKHLSNGDFSGKYVHYGVREFAMGAISNGIFLHGGFRPYASTFLIFSEYAKNAIRMSALMHLPIIYIFTHDSIGLGEDGPTHQAVEQMTSLRIIPGMNVWRPADLDETAIAWKNSLKHMSGPSSIVLSRQSLPAIPRTKKQKDLINNGGYIVFEPDKKLNAIIVSSGSELHISIDAAKKLKLKNINVRVVSMVCMEKFLQQNTSYQNKVLPSNVDNILAVEAGIGDCWDKFIGKRGKTVGMKSFGLSAPAKDVFNHFGFTTQNIVSEINKLIKKNRKVK